MKFLRLRLFIVTLCILFWCLIKPKEIQKMYDLADEAMRNNKQKELIDNYGKDCKHPDKYREGL